MSKINITKKFNLELAHALLHYQGPCRNIHGHSYQLSVTVRGPVDGGDAPEGMVMDFRTLKKVVNEAVVNEFDHSLVLNENTPREVVEGIRSISPNLVLMPCEPTAENLLLEFAKRIKAGLPEHVELHHLHLQETATSWAEWRGEEV